MFRPLLAEYVASTIKKGSHVLVEGSLDAIIAGLSTSDEAFVCRFDQFFHPGKGFVTDQDKLLTELKRTRLDEEPSVAPPSVAMK